MKKTLVSLLLVLMLTGCKKDDKLENSSCNNLITMENWTRINFKSNYTIQLPDGFEGPGMVGFEGNMFIKNSTSNKIKLSYSFCTALFCNDFGSALQDSTPKSIQVMDDFDKLITLNRIEFFCQNSETLGILYYSNNDITKSKLYWKDNAKFKEALDIDFYASEIETVKKIIETIKMK